MLHRHTEAAAATLDKAAAAKLGVAALCDDAGSMAVRLGVFSVPGVSPDIINGPRGACTGMIGTGLGLSLHAWLLLV